MLRKKITPLFALALLSNFFIFAQTPCSGGMAGSYPCDGLTLQGYVSSSAMGSFEAQDSWGWTDPMDSKEYAIVALDDGTAFVDISVPTAPVYLGRLNSHTGSSLWRDVKTYANHAYIVSDSNGDHGMQVFDLTRLRGLTGAPAVTFTEDGWVTWGTTGSNRGRAHNLIINEATGYAYVIGVSPYNSGGPVFFDLSTPTSPSFAGRYSAGGYCHDAQVVVYNGPDTEHVGKELLIGSFSNSDFVKILDVSNKSSVSQIGQIGYTNKHYTHQGWFTEDQRYFIVGDELDEQNVGFNTRTLVFDMTDLDNPVLHYTYTGSTSAIDHNGYVRGNRYYLANYSAGMRVLRIDGLYDGTPSMTEVDYFDTYPANNNAGFDGVWNVYPFFESGNLVVSGFGSAGGNGDGGLFILKDPNYDNTDPVAVCQNITATLNKTTGSVTITALDVDGGSTDNIGITKRSIDIDTFTCDDVGVHSVTLTVEDDYGNTSTCVAQVTVVGETTSYVGAGVWSNGTPDIGSNAKIATNYDMNLGINPSIEACTCEIDAGRTLTISANKYIEITKDIDVNGTLIVEHQGVVVQTDPNATVNKNGGAVINVEVTTPVLKTRDFMVMGSPMDAETRNGVFTNAFLVLNHTPVNFVPHAGVPAGGTNFADDNGDFWNAYNGSIDVGEGYIVRPQSGYTDPANITYDMTYSQGTLNNGTVNRSIVYHAPGDINGNGTPNVVANPYASPISATSFLNDNGLSEIYFWEHITPPSSSIPGAGSINFSMDNVSIRNVSGGVAAPAGGAIPSAVISTGQGFALRASANGTVSFTNSMRLNSGNTTLRQPDDVDRIWLNVTSTEYENLGSNMLVAFNPEATAGLDNGYDTDRLASTISVYSQLENGDEQLSIQTREAFDSEIKIPIGFASQVTADASFKISIAAFDGPNMDNVTVFLMDNQANIRTNLTEGDYLFKSVKGTFNGRFTLEFEAENILDIGNDALNGVKIYPNPADDQLHISSPDTYITNIDIYDVRGRRLSEEMDGEINSVSLDISFLETAIYFVKIDTKSGSVTKKLIKK